MKVLVLYACKEYPTRATILDYIYCFRRYSEHKIYYVNYFFSKMPRCIRRIDFDIVIFHNSFTAPWYEIRLNKKINKLKNYNFGKAKKIALFQDEFFHSDLICKFINKLNIDNVFSVAPQSEWSKIYYDVDFKKVKFNQILTGYIDENIVKNISAIGKDIIKDIDIGYRTSWGNTYRLGRFGSLKIVIADIFKQHGLKSGLKIDISTDSKDNISGIDWYKFLLRSKYTIGVESGSSLLDVTGEIDKKINQFKALNPQASFDEVEAACFPGMDGNLNLAVVSPRHFEASITKTCQILIEGKYNGIFRANEHYIELKKDFSNIDEVIEKLKKDDLREQIVERTFKDVVVSGKYTYRSFVKFIFEESKNDYLSGLTNYDIFIYNYLKLIDFINWGKAFIFANFLMKFYNLIVSLFSEKLINSIREKFNF